MQLKEKSKRVEELDALRGLAALAVVIFHYTMWRGESLYGFIMGVTAVDVFFMISGFVIFMSLKGNIGPVQFFKKRVIRLFPVYIVVVTFTSILIMFNWADQDLEPVTLSRYLANLTMFQKLLGESRIDGPYWTMLIEMQFYIIVVIALLFGRVKLLISIGWGMLTLVLFNELVVQPIDFDLFVLIFKKMDDYVPIMGHFPFFFAGIFFYQVYQKQANGWTYLGIAASYLTALLVFQSFGASHAFIELPQYIFTTSIYFGIFYLFVTNRLGWIVGKGTLYLGKISYPLYLIHQFLGFNLLIPLLEKKYHIHHIQGGIISLVLAIVLAHVLTKYVEQPFLRFIRSREKSIIIKRTPKLRKLGKQTF